ncbi:MAG: tetratricopeptide repeat protein [Opitutaceae bacterium]|nr:tetratricopeptide repeat protein [Opitutaceae bacterium]
MISATSLARGRGRLTPVGLGRLVLAVLATVVSAGTAAVAPEPPPGAPDAVAPPAASPAEPEREIQSFFNLGSTYADRKDYASAELAYQQILNHAKATRNDQRRTLLTLARMYRQQGADTRAVACYEKYLKVFPNDDTMPAIYLELGRALRSLGAYRLALARFYSVINTTLKISGNNFDQYRVLAKTAQFEIAETHFQEGDYAAASRYFSRLQLLELAPADRARAQFKAAYALVLAKDYAAAAEALHGFLDQYPADENGPEARYLLAVSLRRLGRTSEALDVVLALLRAEQARQATDPRRWRYWQRRTGNELANGFYEQGNFWAALVIYEALAGLSAQEPAWRLPALYEAGLCYERLGQYDRARTNYETVIDDCAKVPPPDQAPAGLDDLALMASWRRQHLDRTEQAETQVASLFHTIPSPRNDPSGPVEKSPRTLQ